MGARVDPQAGLVVLSPYFRDAEYLAPNTAAALTSDYSQAGAGPGTVTPVSGQTLIPRVHLAQDAAVKLYATRGGYAGTARMAYSLDDGTTYRGWVGPTAMHRWDPIVWSTATDYVHHGCDVFPESQRVILAYAAATSKPLARVWSGTWGAAVELFDGFFALLGADAVVVREDLGLALYMRANLQVDVYRTTDQGATWALHSEEALLEAMPDTVTRISAAYADGQILLIGEDTANAKLYHYVSTDHGTTFRYIGETAVALLAAETTDLCAIKGGQGGFLLSYIADGDAYVRPLPSATTEIGSVPATTAASNVVFAAVGCDYDGTMLLVAVPSSSSSRATAQTSTDGVTWSAATTWTSSGTNGSRPVNLRVACGRGQVLVVGEHTHGAYAEEGSLQSWTIGTWSSIEVHDEPLRTWVPWGVPSGGLWSGTGTAGTIESDGRMQISTSSANGYYTLTSSGPALSPGIRFAVQVDSGGSVTNDDVSVTLVALDGSNDYTVTLRLATTGFRLRDAVAGTTLATVSVDLTDEMEFLLVQHAARVTLAYKRPTEVDWTIVVEDETLTTGATGGSNWTVSFGHASSTAVSRWRYVTVWSQVTLVTSVADLTGRRLSAAPYPAPGVSSAGDYGFLSVAGGVALTGQAFEVEPAYTYALANALPALSPSPDVRWRTIDTTEQIIAWDLGAQTWLGGALGLLIQKANFRTAYLEAYVGSSWSTVGTWDAGAGFAALTFDRVGSTISPASGTATGARYIKEDELAGGHVVLPVTVSDTDLVDEFGVAADATVTGSLTDDANGVTGVSDTDYAVAPAITLGVGEYLHYFVRVRRDAPTRENFLVARTSSSDPGLEIRVSNTPTAYSINGAVFGAGGAPAGGRALSELLASPGDDLWLLVEIREDTASVDSGAVRIRTFTDVGVKLQDSSTYQGTKPVGSTAFGTVYLGRDADPGKDASEIGGDGLQWAVIRHTDSLTDLQAAAFINTGSVTAGSEVWYYKGTGTTVTYVARRIRSNSAGVWSDDATATPPHLVLDGVTGSEDASGSCTLVWPSGLLLYYPPAHGKLRYWRLRIPAQVCPDSYFEAGVIGIGRLLPFGRQHTWGWSQETLPNFREVRNDYGTARRTQRGPNRRTWTLDFSDGLTLWRLRQLASPDRIGVSGGVALGSVDDVWWVLEGVLGATKGASVPVVACSKLPSSSGMVLDRSLYLYGYLSGSVQWTNSAGEEGVNEHGRIERFVVDGIA